MSRPTERFSSRVEHYVRYRPSYPSAAIDLLKTRCGLSSAAVVADIGSGTGILTEQLLESGAQVIGVEPNDEMRVAAEARLGAQARFRSVNGTAEATTLPPASIDLLVAGQAFHWFDVEQARREALRLLRSAGFAALLWNERPPQATAFLDDYEALLLRHSAEYAQIKASRADEASMRRFFGGAMELATFPNQQSFDLEGLKGRLMSSSYAPEPGDPQHQPMMAGLRELFGRHQHRGQVVFPYRTLVYFGQPQRPGR
ncbi:MAG TPA: class I SAM-dependent methyltransferase [Steroidobacteraceae bacterium]|nr:class I SAM-dependent methyltransferase [Steroidobacteraceae bacterium]